MKLVTAEQMRRLEMLAEQAGISTLQLMENAGLATAQEAWMLLGTLEDRLIVVLVGPGNNGGDGLVAARHLHDWGADTRVYLSRKRSHDNNLRQLEERGVPVVFAEDDTGEAQLDEMLGGAHLIVDALLGTGRARSIEGTLAAILDHVGRARARPFPPKLLAVDLPSGLNADSGAIDPHTPAADETVTFGLAKAGLYLLPGSERAGRIQVVDIGIPTAAEAELPLELVTSAWVRAHLPQRPADSNKGTFGKVLSAVGSFRYIGAAYLASAAAYRSGAGLVALAVPSSIRLALASMVPEAVFLPLTDGEEALSLDDLPALRSALGEYDALLVGCGIGPDPRTQAFVRSLLAELGEATPGIVVDADGLNALAAEEDWPRRFRALAVLTPHPGEFARLARLPIREVQADRIGLALRCAREWQKILVLKGAHTVIATPDGHALLSPFANAALATAGTGDVLAGTIAGLIAQGLPAADAAVAGVYLHGVAGELLARDFGDAGGLAGDLLRLLPEARREVLGLRPPSQPGAM